MNEFNTPTQRPIVQRMGEAIFATQEVRDNETVQQDLFVYDAFGHERDLIIRATGTLVATNVEPGENGVSIGILTHHNGRYYCSLIIEQEGGVVNTRTDMLVPTIPVQDNHDVYMVHRHKDNQVCFYSHMNGNKQVAVIDNVLSTAR